MMINQPHGYLLDSDGRVVLRFANWSTGDHQVPEVVKTVDYVDGPNAHEKDMHDYYKTDL